MGRPTAFVQMIPTLSSCACWVLRAISERRRTNFHFKHRREKHTLAYEKTNAYPRKIEPIQPCLNVQTDMPRVLTAFPFQNTLRNSCYSWIMATLNMP